MDHKQTDDLLTELENADPAEAADLAVEAARLLGAELDQPAAEDDNPSENGSGTTDGASPEQREEGSG